MRHQKVFVFEQLAPSINRPLSSACARSEIATLHDVSWNDAMEHAVLVAVAPFT